MPPLPVLLVLGAVWVLGVLIAFGLGWWMCRWVHGPHAAPHRGDRLPLPGAARDHSRGPRPLAAGRPVARHAATKVLPRIGGGR